MLGCVAHLDGVNAGTRMVMPVSLSEIATVPSGLMETVGVSIVSQDDRRAHRAAIQPSRRTRDTLFIVGYGSMSVSTSADRLSYSMIA